MTVIPTRFPTLARLTTMVLWATSKNKGRPPAHFAVSKRTWKAGYDELVAWYAERGEPPHPKCDDVTLLVHRRVNYLIMGVPVVVDEAQSREDEARRGIDEARRKRLH